MQIVIAEDEVLLREGLSSILAARGFEVVKEYTDEGQSGAKSNRPALDNMLADAKARELREATLYKLEIIFRKR